MSKQQSEPRVWSLRRSGNVSQNTASVKQRAAPFAASTPDGTVLLTRRGEDGLRHAIVGAGLLAGRFIGVVAWALLGR